MGGLAWNSARTAVRARLWTDATMLTLLGPHPSDPSKARVFDGEPARQPTIPYVIVADAIEDPNNRMGGKTGRSITIPIHAWSKKSTDDERDDIADRIDKLLDNYRALAVTGYVVEAFDMISLQVLTDSLAVGGAWTPMRHAIARYRLDLVEA